MVRAKCCFQECSNEATIICKCRTSQNEFCLDHITFHNEEQVNHQSSEILYDEPVWLLRSKINDLIEQLMKVKTASMRDFSAILDNAIAKFSEFNSEIEKIKQRYVSFRNVLNDLEVNFSGDDYVQFCKEMLKRDKQDVVSIVKD